MIIVKVAKIEFEMVAGVSGRRWCFNGEAGEAACHVCVEGVSYREVYGRHPLVLYIILLYLKILGYVLKNPWI